MLNECLEATLILDAACRRRFGRAGPDDPEAQETKAAIATIRRAVFAGVIRGGEAELIDPDALVKAYIAAGGNWRELTGAVNRHALDGSRGTEE